MATNLGNLAATASLNIDPFQQSTRVLETQMRSIDRALKAQETAWKNNSKNVNAQKAQYNLTGKAIQNYSAQLEKQREKYEGLKSEIGNFNQATADQKTQLLAAEAAVNKTVGQIETLTGKYNELGKQIAISESNWTKSGKVLEEFGSKTSKVGEGLSSFGTKMSIGVTAPIVAGVTAVTKAAIDWESAFAGVKKTNDEVVDSNGNVVYSYADLENGLRNLAKELPSSHKEIASVAEAAGQLGIQTENVVGFTKTMIDLGESTNMGAEEAATALARLANITQLPQDQFDRLGSAIVDLGNNFATTESEITAMALRLAGAGSIVGLSEADILGLSAALSSVGIEAEAGGSSISKLMINMQLATAKGQDAFKNLQEVAERNGIAWEQVEQAVANGGKELKNMSNTLGLGNKGLAELYKNADDAKSSLEDFAYVAGMSGDDFAKAFQEDAVGAIGKFIEGLSHAEEKGTTAIEMLDNMGITEVRLRDALLRAGGASELFGDAVGRSNKAFEENTALSEEAGKRYETVESQLSTLKNEVVDIAIEFGGPFLQALRDGIQAAKPLLQTVGDLAKKFSQANPETQQAIMKYLGLAAAIGPVSKVMGGFLKIAGGGISTIGKFSQWIGKLSGNAKASEVALKIAEDGTVKVVNAMSTGTQSVGLFSKLVAGATKSVWGFSGALGLVTSPLGIAVAAIAAGAFVYKTWGEDALDSARKTQRWGTDVSDETEKTLEKVREFSWNSSDMMGSFDESVNASAKNVEEQFGAMQQTISDTVEEINKKNQEIIESLPEEQQGQAQKNAEEIEKINQQVVEATQSMTNRVVAIYKKHNGDVSQFTIAEKEMVLSARESMIQTEVNLLEMSGEKKKAVMLAMGTDINQMNMKQAGEYAQYLTEAVQKSNESYDKQIAKQKEALEAGLISQSDYAAKVAEIQTNHDLSTQAFADKLYQYYKKMGDVDADVGKVRLAFQDLGLNYDEVAARAESATETMIDKNSILAKSTQDMSNEAIIANEQWNNMVFDPKTGEIKSNAKEIIAEAFSSEEGWNNLEFILKNANLTSNARAEVAIATGEAGKWNELNLDQKYILANGDQALIAFYDAIDANGQWNEYESVVKIIGANNTQAIQAIFESKENLKAWNQLSPELKDIIVNDKASDKLIPGTNLYNEWLRLPDSLKNIKINADTYGATLAQQAINSVNDKNVYIRVHYQGRDTGQTAIRATGDPYFQGGPVWLGDGGKAEPFLTPQGEFGISPPDWTMFNLPRGTKIWPSVQKMMETLPRYANGTKFDDTNISRIGNLFSDDKSTSQSESVVSAKLDKLISLLDGLLNKDFSYSFNGIVQLDNGKQVGRWLMPVIEQEFEKKDRRAKSWRGER